MRTNPLSKALSFLISFKEIYAVLTSLAISNALISFYNLINHNLLNVPIKIFEEAVLTYCFAITFIDIPDMPAGGMGCYLE